MNTKETQRSQTFDETEYTDDDYSIVDIEETGSESGEPESEVERSLIEGRDGSTLSESEEESASEDDQEVDVYTGEIYSPPLPTPTLTKTRTIARADFHALQIQVALLHEQLRRDGLAYDTKLNELDEALNNMGERCNLLESNSITHPTPGRLGVLSNVDVLRSQTEINAQRISKLEEMFSAEGRLKELQEYDWVLNEDLGHMRRILESLSVEQQRLKNNQVANTKTLEKLECQLQTRQALMPNITVEAKFRERFEKNEQEILALRESCKGVLAHVHESQSEFNKIDEEIARVTRHLKAVEQNQESLKGVDLDYENLIKSVEQCCTDLDHATQSLKLSVKEQRQILQRDLHNDNKKLESELKNQSLALNLRIDDVARNLHNQSWGHVARLQDLESQIQKTMDFECQKNYDILIGTVKGSEKTFTNRVEELEQRLDLLEATEATVHDELPQPDLHQLDTRLTICEQTVAQVSRTSIDTIRACKPTVHDCSRVVPQVQALLDWKRCVEKTGNMSKMCFHSNTAEERMENWAKEFESRNEAWKVEWATRLHQKCTDWAVKIGKKSEEMEIRQEEYFQHVRARVEEQERIVTEMRDMIHHFESDFETKMTQHVDQQFSSLLEACRAVLSIAENK